MNVLISSAGRRVGLLRAFRKALQSLDSKGRVLAVDSSPYSSAVQDADAAWLVPRCTSDRFVPTMLEICKRESVDLLVPTIDTELPTFSENRSAFEAVGTLVSVSSSETISISADKVQTNEFFRSRDIPTVRQFSGNTVEELPEDFSFPVVVKPRRGSSALDVYTLNSRSSLRDILPTIRDPIVEEFAPGDEYTINVFVNRLGECISQVPHLRLEVRNGEVSKGLTVRDGHLMNLAKTAIDHLPGTFGALCLQCKFAPGDYDPRFFELNARFGGGFPLTLAAGADFPKWLLLDAVGQSVRAPVEPWREDIVMLRFDEAIFREKNQLEGGASWIRSN